MGISQKFVNCYGLFLYHPGILEKEFLKFLRILKNYLAILVMLMQTCYVLYILFLGKGSQYLYQNGGLKIITDLFCNNTSPLIKQWSLYALSNAVQEHGMSFEIKYDNCRAFNGNNFKCCKEIGINDCYGIASIGVELYFYASMITTPSII